VAEEHRVAVHLPCCLTDGLHGGGSVFQLHRVRFLEADRATGLVRFSTQYSTDYSLVFAATVISFIPTVALYLIFQRQFVQGVNVGATKG